MLDIKWVPDVTLSLGESFKRKMQVEKSDSPISYIKLVKGVSICLRKKCEDTSELTLWRCLRSNQEVGKNVKI